MNTASTVTQTRPDQATGFRHISDPVNAAVAKVNATQPANAVAMHNAVDRWIAEAKAMAPDAGAAYLDRCRARVDANIQNLADYACDRAPLWKHLQGLTVDHLEAAGHRIDKALREVMPPSAAPASVRRAA